MNRRAFTMIEVMLAAVLGTMVVLTAMTLFASISATQHRTAARDFGTQELARLNNVMRKALTQIVVKATVPKRPPATPAVARPRPVDDPPDDVGVTGEGEAAGEAEPEEHPRVVLGSDNVSGLQRLELVLAEPPLLGGADGATLERDARRLFSKTRGAFVLRPSDGTLPRRVEELVRPDTPSWDLWWVPVDREEEGIAAVGRTEGVIVARGLAACRWRFFRSDENKSLQALTEAEVTARADLPAYFEVDVATVQGQRARWMFEVGWTTESTPRATGAARATGATGATGAAGATGADGASNGPSGGGPVRGTGGSIRATGGVRRFASPDGDNPQR